MIERSDWHLPKVGLEQDPKKACLFRIGVGISGFSHAHHHGGRVEFP